MKRLYFTLISILCAAVVSAQNPTSYFMEGSPFRMEWNPAFAPDRGYVNIPMIGNFQTHVTGNVSLDEFVFPHDDGLYSIFSSTVPASVALEGLEEINKVGAEVNLGFLGFGTYTKNRKNFWSVEVKSRGTVAAELPYSLFEFIKNGTSADISGVDMEMSLFTEASFSYSFPLLEKLHVGVRGKLMMGMTRMQLEFEQFDAVMGEDEWYAEVLGTMRVSGLQIPVTYNDKGEAVYSLEDADGVKIPSGFGVGVDLGVTYDLLPNLQLSASINDIGFMKWSKSATTCGQIKNRVVFDGVEIDEEGNVEAPELNLDELDFRAVESSGKAESLFTSFNLGGQYSFLNNKIGVGLFYTGKLSTYKTYHNITASANFRPLKWLHLSGSYSFLNNKASAVGLALNICPSFINFFVATDILLSKKTPQWIPIEQNNMNVSFGLGVPIGKRGNR